MPARTGSGTDHSGAPSILDCFDVVLATVPGKDFLRFREGRATYGEFVYYCPYPIYHWDATVGTVVIALVTRGTAALAPRFSVTRFWEDIRAFGATVFDFMGATLTFLHNQPERPDDADNPVRLAWGVPMPPFKAEFERGGSA